MSNGIKSTYVCWISTISVRLSEISQSKSQPTCSSKRQIWIFHSKYIVIEREKIIFALPGKHVGFKWWYSLFDKIIFIKLYLMCNICRIVVVKEVGYTVGKEMKCGEETQILHELVRDTTRISSRLSDFRLVSWTNSCICSITISPLNSISFLAV